MPDRKRTDGRSRALRAMMLSGACLLAVACGTDEGTELEIRAVPLAGQTTLIGTPLREPDWTPATRARLEQDLEIARAAFRIAPDREESYIWLGRRYGYLGHYAEAIEVFSRGLEAFPDSYRLLRFRGRHLTRNRQFDLALADYRRAAALVEDREDSFEPDGIPNALGLTIGTYKTNIHYYLGQTSFAVGDYPAVLQGMDRGMEAAPQFARDDYIVPVTYWKYLALRKMGRHEAAEEILMAMPREPQLIENFDYYRAVQVFQGHLTEDDLQGERSAIVKFALSMKYAFEGEASRARALQEEIVRENPLGFWPAEVELASYHTGDATP